MPIALRQTDAGRERASYLVASDAALRAPNIQLVHDCGPKREWRRQVERLGIDLRGLGTLVLERQRVSEGQESIEGLSTEADRVTIRSLCLRNSTGLFESVAELNPYCGGVRVPIELIGEKTRGELPLTCISRTICSGP